MKKINIYVFSATGNTMKCAEELKKNLGEYDAEVEITRVEDGTERVESVGDTVVICYPVHGFNAPMNIINFAKDLPESNADLYIMKTSGEPLKVNDNSSTRITKSLTKKGYTFKGEYHFVMPYNMIFKHTDEMAAKMYQTAKERMPETAKTIFNGEEHLKKISAKAKIVCGIVSIEHWGVNFNGIFFHIKKEKCIKCMKCVNNCPTKNITFKDGKFHFGTHCLLCSRCAFNCPVDAVRIGLMDFMRVNGKYNFNANPDEAVIGKYCHKSYVEYFNKDKDKDEEEK